MRSLRWLVAAGGLLLAGTIALADEVDDGIARARTLLEDGEVEGCRELLLALRKDHPADLRPLPFLAYVLFEKAGLPEEAERVLESYLRSVPGDRYALELLALIADRAFADGDYLMSRLAARHLIEFDPVEKEHVMRWGWASYRLGDDPGVVRAACRDLIDKYPSFDRAYWLLARALEDDGRYEEAVSVYRSLLEEHPGDVHVRLTLAYRLLWQLRDYDGAEDGFTSALEIAESDSPARESAQRGLRAVSEQRDRAERLVERHGILASVLYAVLGAYAAGVVLLFLMTRPRSSA